jgi:microcystin-dependent protein
MSSVIRRSAAFTAHEKPTTGDVKMSFVNQDHLGWLLCNGRALSVSEYGILFNVVGYTFGGSGDTFYLPDVSGVVPGIAGPTHAIGTQVGSETHTLTIAEMPGHTHGATNVSGSTDGSGFSGISGEHTHTINDPGHTHSYVNQPNQHQVAISLTTTDTADNIDVNQTTGSNTTGITINANGAHAHVIGSTGGGQAHNNMQPTYFIGNMFIYCGDPPAGTWPYTIPPGGGQPTIY